MAYTENDPDGRHSRYARGLLRQLGQLKSFEELQKLIDEVVERDVCQRGVDAEHQEYSWGFDAAILYGAIEALFGARLPQERLEAVVAQIVERVEVQADGCQISLRRLNGPATALTRSRKRWFGKRELRTSEVAQLLLPFGSALGIHIPPAAPP